MNWDWGTLLVGIIIGAALVLLWQWGWPALWAWLGPKLAGT